MTKLEDFLNRLFVFVVGCAALFVGLLAVGLYFDVPAAQSFVDALRPREWGAVPNSPWFLFTVGSLGVFMLALGFFGLALNLQSHRIRRIESPESDRFGTISFDISEVADAAAQTFAEVPKVIRSRAVVKEDRGRKLLIITVDAEATANLSQLTAHAASVEEDLAQVIADDSIATVFQFHVAPVERLAG
ncbi:hypothetical protein [Corynebacterium sp. H130]|uniref:hypothetical protein n=1 Tax=Corynebacterium sp. H130 TaxID=3133444 RepID=UPI0030A85E66